MYHCACCPLELHKFSNSLVPRLRRLMYKYIRSCSCLLDYMQWTLLLPLSTFPIICTTLYKCVYIYINAYTCIYVCTQSGCIELRCHDRSTIEQKNSKMHFVCPPMFTQIYCYVRTYKCICVYICTYVQLTTAIHIYPNISLWHEKAFQNVQISIPLFSVISPFCFYDFYPLLSAYISNSAFSGSQSLATQQQQLILMLLHPEFKSTHKHTCIHLQHS